MNGKQTTMLKVAFIEKSNNYKFSSGFEIFIIITFFFKFRQKFTNLSQSQRKAST